ncbi:glycosyltransferase [Blastopirellula marina]|nr:glycosyltransferase [Blastopirellula marina]
MERSGRADDFPLVSVIVRTYQGREQLLAECLESIADQSYRPLEVVVVQDGGDSAKETAERFQRVDLTVRFVALPKGNRCIAGNAGLAAAQGEWLNFLDDDDLFLPQHVAVLVAAVKGTGETAAIAESLQAATKFASLVPLQYEESSRDPFPLPAKLVRGQIWFNNLFPIQACLFHRSLYERFGGFEEELDALEDWDLWQRYFSDRRIERVKETTSLFRVPASGGERSTRERRMATFYPAIERLQAERRVVISVAELLELEGTLSARHAYSFGGALFAISTRQLSRGLRYLRNLNRERPRLSSDVQNCVAAMLRDDRSDRFELSVQQIRQVVVQFWGIECPEKLLADTVSGTAVRFGFWWRMVAAVSFAKRWLGKSPTAAH